MMQGPPQQRPGSQAALQQQPPQQQPPQQQPPQQQPQETGGIQLLDKPTEFPPGTFPLTQPLPEIDWSRPMEMPGIDPTTYVPEFQFDDRYIPRYEHWEIPPGTGII